MRLSARLTLFACIGFGLVCLAFAGQGLYALLDLEDEAQRSLTRGYTGFWLFLCGVALVFGLLSHLMVKGRIRCPDE